MNRMDRQDGEATGAARRELLLLAADFVNAARQVPGVRWISLIGSLATEKADPKDVDFLVCVSEDVELPRLARLSRRLQGRAQSQGRGADVFLCDEALVYLGRTCPWKNCGPRYRASCDARSCGVRPYLHDDLDDVRLNVPRVREGEIVLWPEPRSEVHVPADVSELLWSRVLPGGTGPPGPTG